MSPPDPTSTLLCPACEADTALRAFALEDRCPRCAAPLRAAAADAREAVDRLRRLTGPAAGLPPSVAGALQATLSRADADLREALTAKAPTPTLSVEAAAAFEPLAPAAPAAAPAPAIAAPPPGPPPPPTLWPRLGPAFTEHLMFFIGGFLLLAGGLYFVSTAWTTMTGSSRLLLVEGGLLLTGWLVAGVGRLLNRDGALDDLERVLRPVAGALVPLAGVAVGRLLIEDGLFGALGLGLLAGLGLALLLFTRHRPVGVLLMAGLAAAAPFLGGLPVPAAVGVGVAGAFFARGALIPLIPLAVGVGAAGVHLALIAHSPALLGPVVAGGALALVRLKSPADLVGLGLAVAAPVIAWLDPTAALAAALLGGAAAAVVAWRRDRPAFLLPALLLSVAAYILMPAPVRSLVQSLRDQAAAGLGYGDGGHLPLSWYGVTCLPYILLAGLAARWLANRGRLALASLTRHWLLGVAVALCLLSGLGGDDLRAPLVVLPAEGALVLLLGLWLQDRWMAAAGPLGLFAAPLIAQEHFGWALSSSLVGVIVLAALLMAVLPRRGAATSGREASRWALRACGVVFVLAEWAWEERVSGWDALAVPLLLGVGWRDAVSRPLAIFTLTRALGGAGLLLGLSPVLPAAPLLALAVLALWSRFGSPRLDRPTAYALTGLALAPLFVELALGWHALTVGAAAVALMAVAWRAREPWIAAMGAALPAWGCVAGAEALRLTPDVTFALLTCVVMGLAAADGALHRLAPAARARFGRGPGRALLAQGLFLVASLYTAAIFYPGEFGPGLRLLVGVALVAGACAAARDGAVGRGAWGLIAVAGLVFIGHAVTPWLPQAAEGLAWVIAAALLRGLLRWRPRWLPTTRFALPTVSVLAAVGVWAALGIAPGHPLAALPLLGAAATLVGVRGGQPLLVGATLAALALPVASGLLGVPLDWLPAATLAAIAGLHGLALRWPAQLAPAVTRGAGVAILAGAALLWIPPLLIALDWPDRGMTQAAKVGWILWAALAVWLAPRRARATTLALAAAPALLAWAPLAGLIGEPARADVDLAVWVLAHAALRRAWGWGLLPLALCALALTAGEWTHLSTCLTALTLTGALAAWRSDGFTAEALPWALGLSGVLGLSWYTDLDPLSASTLPRAALIIAGAGAVGGLLRRSPITVYGLGVIGFAFSRGDTAAWETSAVAAVLTLSAALRARGAGVADRLAFGIGGLITSILVTARLLEVGPLADPMLGWIPLLAASWTLPRRAPLTGANAEAAGWLARCCLGVVVFFWGSTAILGPALPASVAWTLPAAAVVLLLAWRPIASARALNGLVVAAMLLHAVVARATPWLALLDGHHLHAWAALSVLALAVRPHMTAAVRDALLIHAFVWIGLPLLDVSSGADLALTALLGTVTTTLASVQLGHRGLRWVALGLANVAACALWFDLGVVDPAFYGLPPGLTLLAAAEIERPRLSARAHLALFGAGLALAYGAVAFEVLDVGSGAHAVLLASLGLVSLFVGWRLRRADLLIGGAAAVVLDVICYLIRNGFQRDFTGAGLLLLAGITVLGAGTLAARQRRGEGAEG